MQYEIPELLERVLSAQACLVHCVNNLATPGSYVSEGEPISILEVNACEILFRGTLSHADIFAGELIRPADIVKTSSGRDTESTYSAWDGATREPYEMFKPVYIAFDLAVLKYIREQNLTGQLVNSVRGNEQDRTAQENTYDRLQLLHALISANPRTLSVSHLFGLLPVITLSTVPKNFLYFNPLEKCLSAEPLLTPFG